jgi:hypothetical protein
MRTAKLLLASSKAHESVFMLIWASTSEFAFPDAHPKAQVVSLSSQRRTGTTPTPERVVMQTHTCQCSLVDDACCKRDVVSTSSLLPTEHTYPRNLPMFGFRTGYPHSGRLSYYKCLGDRKDDPLDGGKAV